MNKFLFAFVLCFFSQAVFGQLNWEKTNGPTGCSIIDFARDSVGNVYAVPKTDIEKGIYKSSNNGESWALTGQISNDQLFEATIEVAPNGVLYVLTKAWLFKSEDFGETWTKQAVSFDLPIYPYPRRCLMVMADESILVASEGHKIYRSSAFGESFELLHDFSNSGFGFSDYLSIYRGANGTLWFLQKINTKRVMWKSIDNGLSVSISKSTDHKVTYAYLGVDQAVAFANGNTYFSNGLSIFKSTDEGTTWDSLTIFPQGIDYRIFSLQNEKIACLSRTFGSNGFQKLFLSEDSGTTWIEKTGYPLNSLDEPVLGILNSGEALGSIEDREIGIWKSSSDFTTWDDKSNSIFKARVDFIKTNPASGAMYSGTESGLFRSLDQGLNWERLSDSLNQFFSSYVRTMAFSPDGSVYYSNGNSIFKSIDEGQNWFKINSTFTTGHYQSIVSSPTGRLFKYGSQSGDLIKFSDNDGLVWQSVTPPITFYNGNVRWQFLNDTCFFILTNSSELLRSTDAGQSWRLIGSPILVNPWGTCSSIHATDGSLYISDSEKLYKSTDFGNTWLYLYSLPVCAFEIRSASDGRMFASNGLLNIYYSDDFGETWAPLTHSQIKNYKSKWEVTDNYFLIGTEDNSIFRSKTPSNTLAKLTGHLKKDQNQDCTLQPTDLPLENWLVTATDSLGQTGYGTTDSAGFYRLGFILPDSAARTLAVEVEPPNFLWQPCDSLLMAVVSPSDDTASGLDFPIDALVDCPLLDVSVGFWPARPCFSTTVVTAWCNLGTVAATDATISVVLDPAILVDSTSLSILSQAGDTLVFALGTVGIGACGQLKIFGKTDCDVPIGQSVCLEAFAKPDSICGQFPAWSGAELRASAVCAGDSVVDFKIKNIGDAPSTSGLEYIVIEDQILLKTGSVPTLAPQAEMLFSEMSDGSAFRLEIDQEPGHPLSIFSAAWVEGCGADGSNPPQFGWILPFLGEDGDPFSDHFCRETSAAYDPNAKEVLPRGIGSEHFILKNQALDYTIFFQNTGNDTAFQVVLRDTISDFLDLKTLRMGAASHPFEYEIYGAGILKIIFKNILLPDSTTNETASHGWVSFKIDPKNDLALGSVIRNKAGIYFDFNAPILTNETWQTIGENFLTVSVFPFSDEKGKVAPIQVSPNPFSESAFFDLKSGKTDEPLILKIMDSAGRVVRSERVAGPRFAFERKNLAAGFWLFSIENVESGAVRAAGKLVAR